jgi:hypothetical protein
MNQSIGLSRAGRRGEVVVRRVLAAGLLVFLVGCGSEPPDGGSVQLLTGAVFSRPGCFTDSASGRLVTDPKYGTAIVDEDLMTVTHKASVTPVAWKPGFTARRAGDEVEVLAPDGHVVAITGKRYRIDGGYVGPYVGGSSGWPGLATSVFWACDQVVPQ